MKNTLSNVLIFADGAAIGSVATWYLVKTKYEKIAQEEIDSVKEEFSKHRYDGPNDADEAAGVEPIDIPAEEEEPVEDTSDDYKDLVQKLGYHNYSDVNNIQAANKPTEPSEPVAESNDDAYVITPEEFGELDYKIVELTLWADGVLTDVKNKRIQDVDGLIGRNTLERFGEYEPDALHVRNDEKKIDFEIMRDLKRYSDFFDKDGPQQAEEE